MDEEFTAAGVERLARTLMEHVYGEGAWEVYDEDDFHDYYLADAREILTTHPHLASLSELGYGGVR